MTIYLEKKLPYLIIRSGKFGNLVTSFFIEKELKFINGHYQKIFLYEIQNLVHDVNQKTQLQIYKL